MVLANTLLTAFPTGRAESDQADQLSPPTGEHGEDLLTWLASSAAFYDSCGCWAISRDGVCALKCSRAPVEEAVLDIRGRKTEIFFLLITLFAEVSILASRGSAQKSRQIALPMTWNGTVFDFRWSFASGYGVEGGNSHVAMLVERHSRLFGQIENYQADVRNVAGKPPSLSFNSRPWLQNPRLPGPA